jgi:putative glutamine amidotransferase
LATEAGATLHPIRNHVATRHEVAGALPAREVNSYHALAFSQCPEGYEVLATASDGSIEAIRHRTLPWQGWMWHPEREDEFSQADITAIAEIFS